MEIIEYNDSFSKNVKELLMELQNNLISLDGHGKLHLHDFNYFATFTYADGKHSEESFKKKLIQCFWNFTKRKDWQYVGVWERAPKTNRLHFHGIMAIPDGTMPGEIIEVNDWDSKCHRRQITLLFALSCYFGIDLRCCYACVPEDFLYGTQVCTVSK